MRKETIAVASLLLIAMAVTGCAESKQEPGKSSEEIHTAVEDKSGTTDTNAAVELKINSSETGEEDSTKDYVIELDPEYNVPTDELLKKFPIRHQTPAATELSAKIQNRMLNGFNRWNMGYEAWEHWGEVLYHDDSIYNVNAVRLTLPEYQNAMDVS